MKIINCLTLAVWASAIPAAEAEELRITSLSQNGLLTWTNSSLNVTCRVEWAPSANGPWSSSWETLSNILVTNQVTSRSVPMFYRVVASVPQLVTNIPAATALALLNQHRGDPNFVVLDVRTPAEYASRHITNAVNLDYYSTTFQTELAAFDHAKTYLVYCGSGGRSGKAATLMGTLGFAQVYNLLNGLPSLAALPEAASWLQP